MITSKTRKTIFYYCRKLGYNTETRHTIQESVCGKSSLSDFNNIEAQNLLKVLREEMHKANLSISVRPGRHSNHLTHGDNVHNLPTPEQKKKIIAMSMQLYGSYSDQRMDAFCERQFHKPFKRITAAEAIRLIEIQKTILRRKHPEIVG